IGAAFAVLLGAAAYLFTSVPVQVSFEPGADRASFDGGGPDLAIGSSHLLRAGNYTLVAESKGYETLRAPVNVTRGAPQHYSFKLVPLPGRLRVELPVPGEVRIAGKPAGKVPGEIPLKAGKYDLVIDTERYLDFATTVQIEGFGKVQTLTPKLVPGW